MRFAFAGFDRWCSVFDAFIRAGWEPVAMFTIPVDNVMDFNDQIVARADQHRLPLKLSRLREDDLRALRELKCDLLVVAGYGWKIPDWTPYLPHAVNFHPSPLPQGRGPYPPIQAMLDGHAEWGVSCHRLAAEFDTGDVLDVERFALSDDECHETMQLKLQMATRRLAARVACDFHRQWEAAEPQGEGSYWPRIDDARRTLDFTRNVDDVMRVVRACGLFECFAPLRNARVSVKRAHGWHEAHTYTPGEVVHEYRRWVVIAVPDGFVALIEWSPLPMMLRQQMGP